MHPRFANFEPLFNAFHDAGFALFIVGGCVRDTVMGAEMVGDVDFATSAPPDQTTKILTAAGFRCYPIGERFGTITVLVSGLTVEITTYRVGEVYERGSRHPVVEFGTDLNADLARRDLSINAMAMDADGNIEDPFDGQRAIRERLLEVPGGGFDNTISILRDDPLRLLRVARFAARFAFLPTPDTTAAARVTAPSLRDISRERWKAEMDKLLAAAHADVGLRWLHEVQALPVILPFCADITDADMAAIADTVQAAAADVLTRWALLIVLSTGHVDPFGAGAGLPDAQALADVVHETAAAFRFSRRERSALLARTTGLIQADDLTAPWSDADLRRFYVHAPDDAYARIDIAAALARHTPALGEHVAGLREQLDALLADSDPTPRLPTGFGAKLRQQFALSGPAIGEAMDAVKDAILEGDVPNDDTVETYLAYFASR